jgi:PAS domain S-box-containing protein
VQAGRLRGAFWFVVVSGAYVGAAKVGLDLDVAHGVITPVWAPSGIALASLLVLGLRYWPAVAVGAFVANVTNDSSAAVAAAIAIGNTLEPVVGAALIHRAGFRPQLDRVRSVLALTVFGALLSTAIAATNGVTVLTIADQRPDSYGDAWVLWWFGDAVGALMVAPLLLVASTWRPRSVTTAEALEAAVLLAALVGTSLIVFHAGAWRYPYLLFPLLLWAAIRFKSAGAATASFVVGAIGTWGAVAGNLPLSAESATERVQIAQALFALVAVTLLVVGATIAEREAGNAELVRVASGLAEAQSLAHIGSWEWDIETDVVIWSDELYRIYGLDPTVGVVDYARYLETIHPDDREFVNATVSRAREELRPYAFEHRVLRPDGSIRTISGRGRVIVEGDEPVRMVGTAQDVTEQRQADRLREDILSAVSHELRTPLTTILGFAVTLEQRRDKLTQPELDRIVAELSRAARRLERLLVDLLDVERVRRGALTLTREPTDVLQLVERAISACDLNGRRVDISGGPVEAEVDGPKVERIVENLILNAVKHTPGESSIHVRLDEDGDAVLLAVEDEGPGIEDQHKAAVFETFNRGPKALSAVPGAGIGLSLVARFAEAHGGRAWVEDRPGGGASVRVVLPRRAEA